MDDGQWDMGYNPYVSGIARNKPIELLESTNDPPCLPRATGTMDENI